MVWIELKVLSVGCISEGVVEVVGPSGLCLSDSETIAANHGCFCRAQMKGAANSVDPSVCTS